MTRKDYYEIAVGVLPTEDFIRMFGVEPIDTQTLDYDFDNDVTWNQSLEIAYNEFVNSVDYYADDEVDEGYIQIDLSNDDGDFDDYFDDYESNMPCDDSGFCSGTNCPNFFKCRG